jgi:hypothetical protein
MRKYLTVVSILAFFVLWLISAQVVSAQDAAGPQPALAASHLAWKIICHGISSVPMTADAAQALPLQIVATLKCGEDVAVLSDAEGYTMHIETSDGRIGYVAAMYVKKAPKAPRASQPESAFVKNGVAHWRDGAPGCDHFISDGSLVESLTVDGVTVQVSLHDTGWKFRANVAVANGSARPLQIDPAHFILDDVGPNGKPLFYQDPVELAKNMTHQVLWTAADAQPASPQIRASSESANNGGSVNVDYRTPVGGAVAAPNYLLQHQAAEDDAIRKQGKQTLANPAEQIRALALKAGTVEPNGKATGSVWFERSKNPQQLILRIPVENNTFEFSLSFKEQK